MKNLQDIPQDAHKDEYIDEKTDYKLRMEAVNKNLDICNAVFKKRMDLLWDFVLKPMFGAENFIKRFES